MIMSETKVIDIKELKFDEHNFNRHNDEGMSLLEKSIKENGLGRSILLDKDNNIVGGNGVTEKAIELGKTKVRIIETDGSELIAVKRTDLTLDSEKGRKMALADNSVAHANLEWNEDELQKAQDEWGLVPEEWGFDPSQLEVAGMDGTASNTQTLQEVKEDDFDPDAEHYEPKVKRGDVWLLGNHRLMCGDSTDPECFAKLMNGERADIAFTSPPYGVNDGSIRKHQEKGKSDHEAKNFYKTFDDNQGVWPTLIEETWQRMHENSDQQFINIQMLADNKRELARWCARHADNLCDIMIWDKGHAAPQMQANIVSNNFEFIYVFGDDKASRVIKHGNFHGTYGAIVRVGVGQNEYADIHKAVFPVALPGEILNINGNAKSVLDCFGGTGTTMIACEQLGRKCRMMELDPHYCDVIIARWEKLTGQKAVKLDL